jgi:hypothetical protein
MIVIVSQQCIFSQASKTTTLSSHKNKIKLQIGIPVSRTSTTMTANAKKDTKDD